MNALTTRGRQSLEKEIREVEAKQAVGMEQAKALEKSEIKIIANTGSPSSGLNSVMDLFSSHGGTQVGALLTGLAQTEPGQKLLDKAGLGSGKVA